MNTKVVSGRQMHLEAAAKVLKSGGLVAFPTETVYGLGANALDESASAKIYQAKGRPSDNPLIAHISSIDDLEKLVYHVPDIAKKLADLYWPGPLTLVFEKRDVVPYGTTGGLDTVAIRMPANEIARELIRLAGVPIAAPSANLSGRPSPTRAEHVIQDMDGRIDMIIDGGSVGIGLESTIVDVTGKIPVILRPGSITYEMLKKELGEIEVDKAIEGPLLKGEKPKAPGMKYKHYAPKAELKLVAGMERDVVSYIKKEVANQSEQGQVVGIICTEDTKEQYSQGIVRSIGYRSKEDTIAQNLFAVLREFDDLNVDYIYSESFSKENLGHAIMNRLMKAAGYHMIEV